MLSGLLNRRTGEGLSEAGQSVAEVLAGDDLAQVCRDIPEAACHAQPRNYLLQVASLTATKCGDGLADPKLVLTWLLHQAGVPQALIGLLVPLRESLALLPQLLVSARLRQQPLRKRWWALANALQGLAVAGMAAAGWLLQGVAAGVVVLGLMALFAVARAVASIATKDVLGKTVSKRHRGSVTGAAGTAASAITFAVAAALALHVVPLTLPAVAVILCAAGIGWGLSCVVILALAEVPGATEGGVQGWRAVAGQFGWFRRDPQLRVFVGTRALLISTALAPPFYLMAAGSGSGGGAAPALGPFMIATALASMLSTWFWGRLSDRSSRQVLMRSALIASIANGAAAALTYFESGGATAQRWMPLLLFVLMVAHQGVRMGRSVHVVDMSDRDTRATYAALANTTIGAVLLAGGVFGVLAQWAGIACTLTVFAGMSLMASWLATRLREVQQG